MPLYRAVVCGVCDKVGRDLTKGLGLPPAWRRVTISNPHSMKKRGVTIIACSAACAAEAVKANWDGDEVMAA